MTAVVPALVDRARTAQAAWGARPVEERAEVLGAMRRWIVANRAAIVESTIRETGKTYEDALSSEVFLLADAIRFWERKAARHGRDERIRGRGPLVLGRKFIVRRRPLGVVGVIAPWNYPLATAIGDSAPALMAGNAVVIKPSEITPLTTTMVVDGLVRETGLPEDVLLVAAGRGGTGAALVDHVDMICSPARPQPGGASPSARQRLIPVPLELGGKDPMIVLRRREPRPRRQRRDLGRLSMRPGVHVGRARLCRGRGPRRVHRPSWSSAWAPCARHNAADAAIDIGAMTFRGSSRSSSATSRTPTPRAHACSPAGRVAATGRVLYYEPTVLVRRRRDMDCMREETFGPTLPVMRVRDADEAVRLANDTRYGLSSSMHTRDTNKDEAIARRIRAGNTAVNDGYIHVAGWDAPYGGSRDSGVGARNAREGILKYTEPHTIMITRRGPKKDIGWLPNFLKRITTLLERAFSRYYSR